MTQFGIGELEGRMRAARSHFLGLLAEQDRRIAMRGAPDLKIALDFEPGRADSPTRAARDMTVFAFDNSGTGVVLASDPLQRCLRDIFTGLKHASFTPAILTRIGKARLGLGAPMTRMR